VLAVVRPRAEVNLMTRYRATMVAGWIAVAVLTVAGFAAFSPNPEAASGSEGDVVPGLGQNAGAVSALTFAYLAEEEAAPPPVDLDAAVQRVVVAGGVTSPPTTAPPPAPYDRGRPLSAAAVRELVSRYFRPEDVNRAVRIAWCESTFNPRAVNATSSASGLFQHLRGAWAKRSAAAGFAGADIFDPEANTAVAAWLLYEGGGWSHWVCTG